MYIPDGKIGPLHMTLRMPRSYACPELILTDLSGKELLAETSFKMVEMSRTRETDQKKTVEIVHSKVQTSDGTYKAAGRDVTNFALYRQWKRTQEVYTKKGLAIICKMDKKEVAQLLQAFPRARSLTRDFVRMKESGEMCDITIECDGRSLSCHKFVLAARSDVFKTMFSHSETKEATTNKVWVTKKNIKSCMY